MGPSTRAVVAAIALTTGAVVAACTSAGEQADDEPVATSTTSTTTTAPTTTTTRATTTTTSKWSPDEQAAIDAYTTFFTALVDVLTSDRPTSDLAAYAGGEYLTKLRIAISDDRSHGVSTRRPEDSSTRAEVRSVSPGDGYWTVDVCAADDLVRFKVADGTILDDGLFTRRYLMRVEPVDGALKVTDQVLASKVDGDRVEACLAED